MSVYERQMFEKFFVTKYRKIAKISLASASLLRPRFNWAKIHLATLFGGGNYSRIVSGNSIFGTISSRNSDKREVFGPRNRTIGVIY